MERQRRNLVSADKDMGDGRAPQNTFGWAEQAILDGTWMPPQVDKVK